jgi:cytochrome c-type biogenesis protein CcmE
MKTLKLAALTLIAIFGLNAQAGNIEKYLECKNADQSLSLELTFLKGNDLTSKVIISRETTNEAGISFYDYAAVGVVNHGLLTSKVSFNLEDQNLSFKVENHAMAPQLLYPSNQSAFDFIQESTYLICGSELYWEMLDELSDVLSEE